MSEWSSWSSTHPSPRTSSISSKPYQSKSTPLGVVAHSSRLKRSESDLATALAVELDIGGCEKVEMIGTQHRHLDDPPFAFDALGDHAGTVRSFGNLIGL